MEIPVAGSCSNLKTGSLGSTSLCTSMLKQIEVFWSWAGRRTFNKTEVWTGSAAVTLSAMC
uniref:Uncharacterized protein n=1 Tax=Anguilla anguilla TaxID=7936 RepID=A0A0E9XY26_ANGAN